MTCIVGVADGENVWIGADSASGGDDGWAIARVTSPKVFPLQMKGTHQRLLIGYTSSFRMGQILQHHLELPEKRIPVPGHEEWYVIDPLIPLIRAALKEHGFTKIEHNEETGGVFLIGLQGHLFRIDSDFHVRERVESYEAIGCGVNFALGSLWVNRLAGVDPAVSVFQALEAADHLSGGVASPFHVYILRAAGDVRKVKL